MVIVLVGLFLVGVALAVYALLPNQDNARPGHRREEIAPPAPVYNLELEQLKAGLDEVKASNEQLKRENAQLKIDLLAKNRELEKAANQDSGKTTALESLLAESKANAGLLEKENKKLTEKIAAAEGQLAEALEKIKTLEGDTAKSGGQEEKLAVAVKENTVLADRIRLLETQIEQYKKDAQDYAELKKKLEEAEEVLRMVHGAQE
jgi:chromosome segregation ATPase